ncbi:MAG: redox-sensing transcriptional repressor Rex [Bacteroidota bacterium]
MADKNNIAKTKVKVPEHSIRRLSVYLRYLYSARDNSDFYVSAPNIAKELNFDPTQIVKDLSLTGIKGKPRAGYNTFELIQAIEDYLNFDKSNRAFLVGAGSLGSALISYPQLESFGIKIVAAFDIDPEKTGKLIKRVNVLPVSQMPELAKRLKVEIGILTTTAEAAQQATNLMVESGIRAIWNFAPINLKVPDDVIVQNTSMYSNVAIMLKKLQASKQS